MKVQFIKITDDGKQVSQGKVYTTNAVEGYHRKLRKVTKTKGAFTSDMALLKLVYLATKNIEKKWTSPLQNWALTVQQLAIRFGVHSKDLQLVRN
jgi:transposase-like protein